MNEIKFTDDEIKSINNLREDFKQVLLQIGQLELNKRLAMLEYDTNITNLVDKHIDLLRIEKDIFDNIQKKYGDGTYDITTNTFTSTQL